MMGDARSNGFLARGCPDTSDHHACRSEPSNLDMSPCQPVRPTLFGSGHLLGTRRTLTRRAASCRVDQRRLGLGNLKPVSANLRIVLQVFGGPLKNNVTVPHYQNAF